MSRRARLVVEPLSDWPYPDVRQVVSPFDTAWTTTRDELLREADHLGADRVVLEVDCSRRHLRQDGELRADARLHSGRVRVSMETRLGPMRWAASRYDDAGLSWAANVRAVVKTLEALRAVDRHGAHGDGAQYTGYLAIEAQPSTAPTGPARLDLTVADDCRVWLIRATGIPPTEAGGVSTGALLRRARGSVLDERDTEDLAVVERTLTGAGSAGPS